MEFEVRATIPATPQAIYDAWLDSDGHGKMTGSPARASAAVGGTFEAWDGYIRGTNLELDPARRIVQSWRTSHFEAGEPDSTIEVLLRPVEGGTELTLRHTNLPPHGTQYESGWVSHYVEPMQAHFARQS